MIENKCNSNFIPNITRRWGKKTPTFLDQSQNLGILKGMQVRISYCASSGCTTKVVLRIIPKSIFLEKVMNELNNKGSNAARVV